MITQWMPKPDFDPGQLAPDDQMWLGWTDRTGSHSLCSNVRTCRRLWPALISGASEISTWDGQTRIVQAWRRDKAV